MKLRQTKTEIGDRLITYGLDFTQEDVKKF